MSDSSTGNNNNTIAKSAYQGRERDSQSFPVRNRGVPCIPESKLIHQRIESNQININQKK